MDTVADSKMYALPDQEMGDMFMRIHEDYWMTCFVV